MIRDVETKQSLVAKVNALAGAWKAAAAAGVAATAMAAVVLTATDCDGDQTGATTIERRASALTASACGVGSACEVHLFLPKGLKASETVVVAEKSLVVSDRAEVRLTPTTFGGVAAAGGPVELGSFAKVGGLSANGIATLRSQSEVHGPLIATSVNPQPPVTAPAKATPPVGQATKISWNVTFATASGGPVTLFSGSRTLAPGRFDDVHIYSGTTLQLHAGAYYVDSLVTEPGARILADSTGGTIVLYVRGDLTLRGSVTASPRAGDVFIGHVGTNPVSVESEFDGMLVSSYADVTIGPPSPQSATFDGLYFGRTVNLRAGAKFQRADVSKIGPGFATVTPATTPGTGTQAPPAPSPTGLTPEQYRQAVEAYLTGLYNSGYDGPTVIVAPHPADTGNQPVASPISTADPTPTASPAAGSLPATVAGGKPVIVADFPRLDPAHVDPPPATPPKTCPLGMGIGLPSPLPPAGTLPPGVNQPFQIGQPRNPSKDFDAYFGVTGSAQYGVDTTNGFTAGVGADFSAGVTMFGVNVEFIHAHADGDTATNRSPHAEGKATLDLLGVPADGWTFSTTTPAFQADLCGALCASPTHLLPHPIDIPIGPVTISLDAALEGQVPANLVLGDGGPNFTVSPMLRAYAIVAGLVGVGLQLGVEGQLDVLRVDLPVDARFNWAFDNSPDKCKANVEFDTGIKFRFSTLNGALFLVARIDVFIGSIELFRWKVMSFDGLVYEMPRAPIVSTAMSVDLPPATCQVDRATCGQVPADVSFADLGPSDQRLYTIHRNYGQGRTQCQGQYITEIPASSLTGKSMIFFANTMQNDFFNWVCRKEKGAATVLKTFDGVNWITENSFEWEGANDGPGGDLEGCVTNRRFDQKAPPAIFSSSDQRVMVYNYEPGVMGLRFAVTATADCESLPLQLEVAQSSSPF